MEQPEVVEVKWMYFLHIIYLDFHPSCESLIPITLFKFRLWKILSRFDLNNAPCFNLIYIPVSFNILFIQKELILSSLKHDVSSRKVLSSTLLSQCRLFGRLPFTLYICTWRNKINQIKSNITVVSKARWRCWHLK